MLQPTTSRSVTAAVTSPPLRQVMTRTLNGYIEQSEIAKKPRWDTTGDDMREGLACVLSVKPPDPSSAARPRTNWCPAKSARWSNAVISESLKPSAGKPRRRQEHLLSRSWTPPAPQRSRAQSPRNHPPQRHHGRPGPARQTGTARKDPAMSELYLVGDSAGGSGCKAATVNFRPSRR